MEKKNNGNLNNTVDHYNSKEKLLPESTDYPIKSAVITEEASQFECKKKKFVLNKNKHKDSQESGHRSDKDINLANYS